MQPAPVQTLSLAALSLLVVGSVMAVGAVHPTVLLIIASAAAVSTTLVVWVERRRVSGLPMPAYVLLALGAWSALQSIPLPMSWLGVLSPHASEIWSRVHHGIGGVAPTWAPLSLDPGASSLEALKWSTYAWVFTLASSVGRQRSGEAGVLLVFVSGVLVGLVTLVHGLAGTKVLFGLYHPVLALPRWGVAPLLNPNNLSGYMNLATFCGVGFLLTSRPIVGESTAMQRLAVVAGLAAVVAGSMLAASRAGVIGLGLGLLVLAAAVQLRGRRKRGHGPQVSVLASIAGGAILALLGASEATWAELRETSTEKLRMLAWSRPLLADFSWPGIGRGAFETTFPRYRQLAEHVVYSHPENFVVQWLVEWGAPVSVLAFGALAITLRPSRVGVSTSSIALSAVIGVAVAVTQNLADLALEVPAVPIAIFAVLGTLYGARQKAQLERRSSASDGKAEEKSARRGPNWRRRWPALLVGLTGLVLVPHAFARGRAPADAERRGLHAVFQGLGSGREDFERFASSLRAAMLRHPGEPYFPLLGAMAARRVRGVNAMPWIAAALDRDPMNGRAHFVLAEVLADQGVKAQALMELRLALERDSALAANAAPLALRLSQGDVGLVASAAPKGRTGAVLMLSVARAMPAADGERRHALVRHASELDPSYVEARGFEARELLGFVSAQKAPCDAAGRARCVDKVDVIIDVIERADPKSCEASVLRASRLELDDKHDEAISLLEERCTTCSEAVGCLGFRVQLASKQKPAPRLPEAIKAYVAMACDQPERCGKAHAFAGDVLAGRGEWGGALGHYLAACEHEPNAERWLAVARAASKTGATNQAVLALEKAARAGQGDPALAAKVEAERRQLLSDGKE